MQGVLRFCATLLAGVAALVVVVSPDRAQAAGSCAYEAEWAAPDASLAKQVVKLVNDHRAGLGLGSVAHSATLARAAEWKAGHMLAGDYVEHDDPAPLSRSAERRLVDCGYSSTTWGENIAYGQTTAKAVMESWLESDGHRANIEHPAFTAVGIGAVQGEDTPVYWAQVFGLSDGGSDPARVLGAAAPTIAGPSGKQARAAGPDAARSKDAKQPRVKRRKITRRGRVAARRARRVGIAMRDASKLTVKVRVLGRKGARLQLRCGGRVKAKARVRARKAAVLRARRVVAGRCRVLIRAPKRSVRYKLTAIAR